MNRLVGNSILIIDSDNRYIENLKSSLECEGASFFYAQSIGEAQGILNNHDIELVLSNYYLLDGLVHHIVDWCRKHMEVLPLFITMGQPFADDLCILRHRHIVDDWSKNMGKEELISRMEVYLRGQEELRESLMDLADPKGIVAEIILGHVSTVVRPTEIMNEGIYFSSEESLDTYDSGILKISLYDGKEFIFFSALGYFSEKSDSTIFFKIYPGYNKTWDRLITELDNKQAQVSSFITKVAGY